MPDLAENWVTEWNQFTTDRKEGRRRFVSNGHHKMGNSAVVLSKRRCAQTSLRGVSEGCSPAKPALAARQACPGRANNRSRAQRHPEGGTPACQNYVSMNKNHLFTRTGGG